MLRVVALALLATLVLPLDASAQEPDELTTHVEALSARRSKDRTKAAKALGEMGEAARPAVPALVECLDDRYALVRAAAAGALGAIGDPSAAPSIAPLLIGDRDDVLEAALTALDRLDPTLVVETLRTGLVDPRDDVRGRSIEALRERFDGAPWAVELLANEEAMARSSAAALWIGRASDEAVDALRPLLRDPSPEVREQAVVALASAPSRRGLVAGEMALLLGDPLHDVRRSASIALAGMGEVAVDPVRELVDDAERRMPALGTLVLIGPPAFDVLAAVLDDERLGPTLFGLLTHPGGWTSEMPYRPEHRLPLVFEAMRDPRCRADALGAFRRQAAAFAHLAIEDPPAWSFVEAETSARLPDPGLRAATRLVLRVHWANALRGQEFSGLDEDFRSGWYDSGLDDAALLALLEDGDPLVRETAAWALALEGRVDGGRIEALSPALGDTEVEVRSTAAWALGLLVREPGGWEWIPRWIDGANAWEPRSGRWDRDSFNDTVARSSPSRPNRADEPTSKQRRRMWRQLRTWEDRARAATRESVIEVPAPPPDWFARVAPRLVALVGELEGNAARSAAWALARAGVRGGRVDLALATSLASRCEWERVYAAEAIVRSGAPDARARATLRDLAHSSLACRALARIGDDRAIGVLLERLSTMEGSSGDRLAGLIADVRPISHVALSPLAERFRAGDLDLASWLVLHGEPGVVELVRALEAPSRHVRGVACYALGDMEGTAASAIEPLERVVADEEDADVAEAARVNLTRIRAAVVGRRQ